jgi:hypothetical protein
MPNLALLISGCSKSTTSFRHSICTPSHQTLVLLVVLVDTKSWLTDQSPQIKVESKFE